MCAKMEQTPTGFDRLIIMKNEWVGMSESFPSSHSASCLKDDNAKRDAILETTHVFN
jgi:hypothetical protein